MSHAQYSAHMGGLMKTLDRRYLATHPAGNERAESLMHLTLPDGVDVENNPDGTRPKVTLKATADTYGTLLAVLSELHDQDTGEIAMAMVFNASGVEITPPWSWPRTSRCAPITCGTCFRPPFPR